MRVTIAGHSFYLQASEVERAMTGIKPEPITGESVRIGRRSYPVKQVGAVISRQDRRDFSAAEVSRALRRLGFTCRSAPQAPEPVLPAPEPDGQATGGVTDQAEAAYDPELWPPLPSQPSAPQSQQPPSSV